MFVAVSFVNKIKSIGGTTRADYERQYAEQQARASAAGPIGRATSGATTGATAQEPLPVRSRSYQSHVSHSSVSSNHQGVNQNQNQNPSASAGSRAPNQNQNARRQLAPSSQNHVLTIFDSSKFDSKIELIISNLQAPYHHKR